MGLVANAPGAWLFLAVTAALAAPQPDPGVAPEVLLARIRLRMKDNLERLPNYTCRQTIERSQRLSSSRRFRLVDAIRLEVALVGGKELFAWPGETSFQDREISQLVSGGAIGNGDFALHARSVFLQGLLMRDPEGLSGRFLAVRAPLQELRALAARQGITIAALCLGFVLARDRVDQLVIGVDGLAHLQENLEHARRLEQVRKHLPELAALETTDEEILIPSNWK